MKNQKWGNKTTKIHKYFRNNNNPLNNHDYIICLISYASNCLSLIRQWLLKEYFSHVLIRYLVSTGMAYSSYKKENCGNHFAPSLHINQCYNLHLDMSCWEYDMKNGTTTVTRQLTKSKCLSSTQCRDTFLYSKILQMTSKTFLTKGAKWEVLWNGVEGILMVAFKLDRQVELKGYWSQI